MSKARSPREVCSTTIGTSGLIERASLATRPVRSRPSRLLPATRPVRSRPSRLSPASPGRPDLCCLALVLLLLLLGRPQLVAGGGLLERDRLCAIHQQV